MSRREPKEPGGRPDVPRGRVRAYLHRFVTCWVSEDPDPGYSTLDCSDGLGQVPDPVCQPRVQVPESCEVTDQVRSEDRSWSAVGGRAGL